MVMFTFFLINALRIRDFKLFKDSVYKGRIGVQTKFCELLSDYMEYESLTIRTCVN